MTSGCVAVPCKSPLPHPVPALKRGPHGLPPSLFYPLAALAWRPSRLPHAQWEESHRRSYLLLRSGQFRTDTTCFRQCVPPVCHWTGVTVPELWNKEQGAHVLPPLTVNTAHQWVGLLKCLTCAVLCYLLLGSEKKERKKENCIVACRNKRRFTEGVLGSRKDRVVVALLCGAHLILKKKKDRCICGLPGLRFAADVLLGLMVSPPVWYGAHFVPFYILNHSSRKSEYRSSKCVSILFEGLFYVDVFVCF